MPVEVILEYKREGNTALSTGTVNVARDAGGAAWTHGFDNLEYRSMMRLLSEALGKLPSDEEPEVTIQRTDRPGLLPYKLDKVTVGLLRTDPVAGLQALSVQSPSPSQVLANIKKSQPVPMPTLRAGAGTLADAFGENVAFKVRGHELECPGCGFWGVYTTPGLLNDPDRAGLVFKTAFVCPKKCRQRFIVSCLKEWGFVSVELLLASKLDKFYLPREWNNRQPWISRIDLQQKFNEYKKEKEAT